MTNNYNAGTAYFSIDGQRYAVVGDLSYKLSGSDKESLNGQDGYHGQKIKPMPGEISAKLRNGKSVDIQALLNADQVTITLELINGKSVIGRNMTRTGERPEVNTEEGEFEIKFAGPEVTEIL